MSPQKLEEAAKSLHDDGQSGFHDDGQWYSDEEEDSFEGNKEMTKTEALTKLRKSKGKTPVHKGKSPEIGGKSQSTTLSKRPRLTRRGSFFDDSDDSETETRETQNSHKARREMASSIDSETEDTANANNSRSKRLKKSRHLDLSSSESEGEAVLPLLKFQIESEMPDSPRKRLRQFQDSSDDDSNEEDESKPVTKAAKLADSGSESDNNELVMDLEPRDIHSPPTDTVDLSSHPAIEECYSSSNDQPGSMPTLAVSQSVLS